MALAGFDGVVDRHGDNGGLVTKQDMVATAAVGAGLPGPGVHSQNHKFHGFGTQE